MTTQDGQKESSTLDPLETSLEAIYRARGWILVVLVTLLSYWNLIKVIIVYAPVFAGKYDEKQQQEIMENQFYQRFVRRFNARGMGVCFAKL